MIDGEKLLAWLQQQIDDRDGRDSFVQYAIYTGLRDRVARGDFDKEDD